MTIDLTTIAPENAVLHEGQRKKDESEKRIVLFFPGSWYNGCYFDYAFGKLSDRCLVVTRF